jgi:hypothetical protein
MLSADRYHYIKNIRKEKNMKSECTCGWSGCWMCVYLRVDERRVKSQRAVKVAN